MGMFDDLQQLKEREETERQAAQQANPVTPKPVRPVPTVEVAQPALPPAKPATKQPTPPPGSRDGEVLGEKTPEPVPQFDITEVAFKSDTFIFTQEEFNALWDLKQELLRTYDLRRATKQNIIRCALHCLIEDFYRNKDKSFVVHRLRNKQK